MSFFIIVVVVVVVVVFIVVVIVVELVFVSILTYRYQTIRLRFLLNLLSNLRPRLAQ